MTPCAAPAAVTPLTEDGPEMTSVDKRLEELLQTDSSPQTLVIALKADAAELRKKRVAVSKDLKNAVKRTKRIRDKAKQLSDADLVAVLRMRTEKKLGDGSRSEEKDPTSPPEATSPLTRDSTTDSHRDRELESPDELPPRSELLTDLASDLIQT